MQKKYITWILDGRIGPKIKKDYGVGGSNMAEHQQDRRGPGDEERGPIRRLREIIRRQIVPQI